MRIQPFTAEKVVSRGAAQYPVRSGSDRTGVRSRPPFHTLEPPDDGPRRFMIAGGLVESELSALVRRADAADPDAADRLFTLLYHELHRLAEHHLRRGASGLTLGSTTLLHEAYLSMSGRDGVVFPDRSRFLAYASRAMRTLVVDYARRRQARKRGRELEITLTGDEPPTAAALGAAEELERLGDALDELASLEPSLASLVDLHFFCGLTFTEIAALRGVSEKTVQRDWRKARMLLQRGLLDGDAGVHPPPDRP